MPRKPVLIARLAALPLAAVVGMLGFGGLAAAPAHAEAADPDIELTVASSQPVLRAADTTYVWTVELRNTGTAKVESGTVALSLAQDRLTSTDQLDSEADETPSDSTPLGEAEFAAIDAGGAQVVEVSVERDDFPLTARSKPGAYLARADATIGESTIAATAPVLWQGVGAKKMKLSTIVPILLPPEVVSMPTRDQLAEAAPQWDALITEAGSMLATLAIDPRVIAGIRAYGDNAPDAARDVLRRLETYLSPTFLLQFSNADLAAEAALGAKKPMQPKELGFLTQYGEFESSAGADGTADAAADGGSDSAGADANSGADENAGDSDDADGSNTGEAEGEADAGGAEGTAAPPTLDELLDWPDASATAWPAEGMADAKTLKLAKAGGMSSAILDSANAELTGGPRAELAGSTGVDTALVTDSDLQAAAADALQSEDEPVQRAGLAEVAARLALASGDETAGAILPLDRTATAAMQQGDEQPLFELLGSLGWVDPATTDEQSTGEAKLIAPSADHSDRISRLRTAHARESSVSELGELLAEPDYLSGYQRARLLHLFDSRYAGHIAGFAEVADTYDERDTELRTGVSAITSEYTQLVGSSTRLPLQLHNALPFEAVVDVNVYPTSAAISLPEASFTRITVPAEGNESVLVPVHSRVSSGSSGISISIHPHAGTDVTSTGLLSLGLQGGVEKVALWALGVLTGLLLVFGIVRSVRHRRSAAATRAGTADPATGPGEPPAPASAE